ncbi:MAG: GCN5-like protein N-acetyltransferase [Comamonadaceae bacterium]|nr:MAG: GCN5-like protein N-acetyltransferase [Comamonadaceae bacterium]
MPGSQTSMSIEWRNTQDGVDWDELTALYQAAPLGNKKAAELQTVFSASMFKCFVYDAGQLVGVGRVLADGVDCAYLCDVAVHPSHQGTGLGKAIVARLVELSRHHKKIILYAVPGKEPFYRKLGFKRMNTAMAIFADPAQALARGLVRED